MDWSIHKSAKQPKSNVGQKEEGGSFITMQEDDDDSTEVDVHRYIRKRIEHLSEKRLTQLHMPGYPK